MSWFFLRKLKDFYPNIPELSREHLRMFSNGLCLLSFWCVLWAQLRFEWGHNPQYQYGLAVPFIGLYLLYLRFLDRPKPLPQLSAKGLVQGLALGLIVVLYPLLIVFETNIDWRMLIWGQTVLVFAFSLLFLYFLGSWPWVRHFAWVFIFFACAVPWPTGLELALVHRLLGFVSAISVDVLHILGVPALQNANIIQVSKGFVSMEEACSGVRSFQSSLMLAYFLGELFRLRLFHRCCLLFLGPLSAIVFNIFRTTLLALLVNAKGSAFANQWHGLAGQAVFLACLAHLSFWGFVLRPSSSSFHLSRRSFSFPRGLSLRFSLFVACALILGLACAKLWYRVWPPKLAHERVCWDINWNSFQGLSFEPISESIQERLFYDEGVLAKGEGAYGSTWLAYYFSWHHSKAAQLGGFHGPELCLPSIGWGLPQEGELFVWEQSGLQLVFRNFKFKRSGYKIYVFFVQWDQSAYPYHKKTGRLRKDRLLEAWKRHQSPHKTNLELVLLGPRSFAEARLVVEDFLKKGLVVKQP
jgi:exosortase